MAVKQTTWYYNKNIKLKTVDIDFRWEYVRVALLLVQSISFNYFDK